MHALLVLVAASACGRLGFDVQGDGGRGDAGSIGDVGDYDAVVGAGCSQAAPFLFLVSPREEGSSGGNVLIEWCSGGITGMLTAELLDIDGVTQHGWAMMAPVADNTTTVTVGSTQCECYFRLQAGGLTYDGPIGWHFGD